MQYCQSSCYESTHISGLLRDTATPLPASKHLSVSPVSSPFLFTKRGDLFRMSSNKKRMSGRIPARVTLALLTASGVMVAYFMRVNLSVAIVAMVHTPTSKDVHVGPAHMTAFCVKESEGNRSNEWLETDDLIQGNFTDRNQSKNHYTDVITLTSTERGMVLGAFFYGYSLTNMPGGRLAELYGTKRVFSMAIFSNIVLTCFVPLATRIHFGLLVLLRVLCGLGQGVIYPAMTAMVAKWIPPLERPRFMSFTFTASSLGTVISLPLCGLIIEKVGWPAVFYTSGAVSLVWLLLWTRLMHDTPEDHPSICQEERRYILGALREGLSQRKRQKIPWRNMLTSVPLWATHTAQIGSMFGFNLLLTQLPIYMSSVLGFSIKANGLLSSLPFLTLFLGANLFSVIGDWLIANQHIRKSRSRKLFAVISLVLPGVVLVTVGYVGCNSTLAVGLFALATCFSGAICSGHRINHLDLAPNLSGTISGMSNTLAFGVVVCVPIIVGAMTPDQSLHQWQAVFWMTAAVYITACLVFVVLGSTEIQPWNYEPKMEIEQEMETKPLDRVSKEVL